MKTEEKGKVAEIGSSAPKPNRKSVYETMQAVKKATHDWNEDAGKAFGVYDSHDCGDVPRALLAVDFLTNFYLAKSGEEMNGQLAAGFAAIVEKCAHEAAKLLAERDALASLALELEEELKSTSAVRG